MTKDNNTEKELTIEEGLKQIETIIEKLESSDVSLEESFKLYEEGINKVKAVNDSIDRIEKKIETLSE
ncbi:MAG: exodeoxyribonuclease VII small subunit [Lachnospiraceae bacterium]|nr:exodeoxyribonuclease VII small subunit [Lachnospiraceae bacterium]